MNRTGWYNISRVAAGTSTIVQSNIDAVFADGIEDAVNKAAERNGLKGNEQFGVSKAHGAVGINQSVFRHNRRNAQIEELTELIEQHG